MHLFYNTFSQPSTHVNLAAHVIKIITHVNLAAHVIKIIVIGALSIRWSAFFKPTPFQITSKF
jgi:hypothetical protein